MAPATTPIDTRIEIVTPENIAFQYRVAGPFRRLPAYLIDVLIRTGMVFLGFLVLTFAFGVIGQQGLGVGLALVCYFLLDWFYGGLFETYWNGQTPGKRMMRIRVVSDEGQPINGWQAVLRNFLRAADALPWVTAFHAGDVPVPFQTYLLGLVTAAMNDRYQRLGDLAAGTMVIIEEPQRHYGMVPMNEPEAIRLAGELPAGFIASRGLARALAAYVQRRQTFPWRRRIEIAMHVGEPLREKLGLPSDVNYDLLLCALYYRTFITDRTDEMQRPAAALPVAVN
ncbi:MAG TPA: RDD family protein [Pirellulales bacterium]|nr:RDD family protein [Pirellulales bacterium]